MLTPLRLKEFFAFPSSHPSVFGLKMMYTLGLALTLSPVGEKNAWLQKWRFRRFRSWYFIWFIMPLCIISLMQPYAFWSWLNFQVAELVELTRRVLRRFAVTPCDKFFQHVTKVTSCTGDIEFLISVVDPCGAQHSYRDTFQVYFSTSLFTFQDSGFYSHTFHFATHFGSLIWPTFTHRLQAPFLFTKKATSFCSSTTWARACALGSAWVQAILA